MDQLVMPTIGPAGPPKCDRYYTENNKTHFIYGGYEGIPENLIINVSVWVVVLILFSLLRKIAWDYGRLALVSRTEARNLLPDDSGYNVWTSLFYGDHTNANEIRSSQESLDTQVHRQDKGICSWIAAFMRIRDENILAKSGRDAVQYLMFQRYLLVYMSVVVVLSIGVILPVNFQGDLEGNTQAFGHTTISNINTNSPTLWVHSVFSVLYLVIIVFFMRHFSVKLQFQFEEDEQATKTLMISNIPRDKCSRNLLLQHFQEAYPEYTPEDIQFAYNISKLAKLDKKRSWAKDGLVNSDAILRKVGSRPTLRPIPCGQVCCCNCNGCKPVDAIDYYKNEEAKFAHLCEQEKVVAFQHTLGLAFVTFEDDTVAARVHKDFRVSCKGAHNPHPSSVSRELGVHNWEVRYAPAPDNIYWENLAVSDATWWCKAIFINFFLFILLFFLTTPSLFLNIVSNKDEYKKAIENLHNPLLAQFLPTLILWAFSALLPILVYYSDQFIGHWTRSSEHHAIMRKCFLFLVLMVLILPSLGLTSAWALLEWLATKNEVKYRFRWQCIFMPDNGAFFVNYVITSAFIGTSMELVRFPELFMYGLKLLLARSAAERTSVRKSVLWEFQFGVQYAWMLCVFSVTMAFSIPCPLITPFGLVYLLLKHAVDRYNIYFAYGPSKIDKNIHTSAINFVIVGVILLQCAVVFFTLLRTEKIRTITIFLLVALFITLLIFSGRLCFGWFKGFSPISYKKHTDDEDQVVPPVTESKPFIPRVLLPKDDQGMEPGVHDNGTSNMAQYGATDPQTPGSVADSEHLLIQGGNEYTT